MIGSFSLFKVSKFRGERKKRQREKEEGENWTNSISLGGVSNKFSRNSFFPSIPAADPGDWDVVGRLRWSSAEY